MSALFSTIAGAICPRSNTGGAGEPFRLSPFVRREAADDEPATVR